MTHCAVVWWHFSYALYLNLISGPKAAAALSDKHMIIMNIGGKALPSACPSSNDSLGKVSSYSKASSSHNAEKTSNACRKSTKILDNDKSKSSNSSSHHKGKEEKHVVGGINRSDTKRPSKPQNSVSYVSNDKCKSTVVYVSSDSDGDFQTKSQIPQKRKAIVLDSDSDG